MRCTAGVTGTSGTVLFALGEQAKTGVYGVATNDATSVGVRGHYLNKTLTSSTYVAWQVLG